MTVADAAFGCLAGGPLWAVSVRQREAGGDMRFVCFSSFATASRDDGQFASCLQTKPARVAMSARGSSVIWYPSAV